ncbi:MAG: chemotaxis protein CheW [Desulfobacterales bacterium]|nr:chemotaxis protein CheW [Desulfobacterales bacterium]
MINREKSFRILLVDDEEVAHKSIGAFLQDLGYKVLIAENGKQALDIFQKEVGIDLVISDVKMPVMDGMELLKSMRNQERRVPVILISAYGDANFASQAVRQGACEYLEKPVNLEKLIASIKKIQDESGEERDMGESAKAAEIMAQAACPVENSPSRVSTGAKAMTDLSADSAQADREGKYLTFALANEEYGIGILKVKEIIGMMSITSVPQTPGFVRGVINLRGKVIPVVDLRLKFGMEEMEYTERTCIIVVEIAGEAGFVLIGIVVDAVSEVLNIKGDDIEDTPTFGTKLDTDYILGMAKMEGGVKILLDIDRVLSSVGSVVSDQWSVV